MKFGPNEKPVLSYSMDPAIQANTPINQCSDFS